MSVKRVRYAEGCLTCAHAERNWIDFRLARGDLQAAIAKEYGLPKGSIFTHNRKHIGDLYRANIQAGLFGSYDELRKKAIDDNVQTLDVTRMAISVHLGKLLDAAQTDSAVMMATHSSQLRQWTEFQSKITRELAPPGNTINNFLTLDISPLLRILRAYPDACKAVVEWYDGRLSQQRVIDHAAD
jgi:hypothetical protein